VDTRQAPALRPTKKRLEERGHLIGLKRSRLRDIGARKRSARRLRALDAYPKRIDVRALGIQIVLDLAYRPGTRPGTMGLTSENIEYFGFVLPNNNL
jgi:hypothetical protein